MLDDDILECFRKTAEAAGMGYQTMINVTLRESVAKEIGTKKEEPLTVERLR